MKKNSPVVKRGEYRPLAWSVSNIDLYISLDPQRTQVHSRLHCLRRQDQAAAPLFLDGEDLELLALSIDGKPAEASQFVQHANGIEITLVGDEAQLEVLTCVCPQNNLTLSGLYLSHDGYFTQCEAQGFRRITFFPDRPDVMACYSVTVEADRNACPVLLSNGNLCEQGVLDNGRHFARWQDPFPKPSYLFALVAARLQALERRLKTASGREVLLQVWVEAHDLDRAAYAMESLIHALRWDEARYGLELDLNRFMIVAVSDFNMGAMENKGLNIFNTKYVLAKTQTATDSDFEHVESVVAHEYFHNWTGNRVTCRDWFQLTLKEGLTVFRDQQFSADMLAQAAGSASADSARAVKRIKDVKILRSVQFREDAGPMAHPIRPDSYREINNFYTATVYEKGAEVIRIQHTLLGEEAFRRGMALYFKHHDGQAVTCDDFVACMAAASGRDLEQIMRWYSQSGTPRLRVSSHYDAAAQTFHLFLEQDSPATADQGDKQPLLIPVAVGLIGPDGQDLPLRLEGEAEAGTTTRVLEFKDARCSFTFVDVATEPVPSLLRGFSAPVYLEMAESDASLAFRLAHDSDAFNRWDAAQRYAERVVMAQLEQGEGEIRLPPAFVAAMARVLVDETLDPAFCAQLLTLPTEAYLLECMQPIQVAALRRVLMAVTAALGRELRAQWQQAYTKMVVPGPYRYHPVDAGRRALRNLALHYLLAAEAEGAVQLAYNQFAQADNMSERFGALYALVNGCNCSETAQRALSMFRHQCHDDALVIDKWLALQATAWRWPQQSGRPVLETVRALMKDPMFSLSNPNKVYALLGSFFNGNAGEFHDSQGRGYVFWREQVMALDSLNPQLAARLARALESWRRLDRQQQTLVELQLRQLAAEPGLSQDVSEIIDKALSRPA